MRMGRGGGGGDSNAGQWVSASKFHNALCVHVQIMHPINLDHKLFLKVRLTFFSCHIRNGCMVVLS